MKKICLLLFAAVSLFATAKLTALTVTISGTVTNIANGTPIQNHAVSIQDTAFGTFVYFNTVMTNTSGVYTVTISNVPSGTWFKVTTLDCNNAIHQSTVNGNNTPITVNFQICTGTPPPTFTVTVTGHVYSLSTGLPVPNHMVEIQDTSGGTFLYYNYTTTNSSGYFTFTIPNVPANTWFWVYTLDCNNVLHSNIVNGNYGTCYTYFQICTIPPPTITVNISGTVTDISNGNPVPNHTVYVQSDSSGGFYYYNSAQTNSSGYYSFTIVNVPLNTTFFPGTYDCNTVYHSQTVNGNNTPILANFQICTGTPPPSLTVSISGTVTDIANGNPVPNHYVTIQSDSMGFYYYNQALTNSAGVYAVTILNVPQNTNFNIGTSDCNSIWHSQTVNGNNTPIIANFQICTYSPPPLYFLYGLVFTGSSQLDAGWVDLIEVDSMNTANVIDTWFIQDTAPGSYMFFNIPAGNYYIRATVGDSSVFMGQYCPTYYDTTLYWSDAILVQPQSSYPPYDIHMVALVACPPGGGTINGVINQNYKTTVPVANAEVLLLDQNNQPLAYTKTNSSGEYSFENIAYGSYVVYPEITQINTIPYTVTLSAGNPSVIVNFTLENGNVFTGIREKMPTSLSSISEVYPNPVTDNASLTIVSSTGMPVSLSVFTTNGQLIRTSVVNLNKGDNRIGIPASGLVNGIYWVSITSDDGGLVVRKVIVSK
jgi:hypothetical protein